MLPFVGAVYRNIGKSRLAFADNHVMFSPSVIEFVGGPFLDLCCVEAHFSRSVAVIEPERNVQTLYLLDTVL